MLVYRMPDLSVTLERYVYELEKEKSDLLSKNAELSASLAKKDQQVRELLVALAKKI